jgi:hypothetical protein
LKKIGFVYSSLDKAYKLLNKPEAMHVTLYTVRPALTLKQNKRVLRASRGKGHHKNPATRQFILSARY